MFLLVNALTFTAFLFHFKSNGWMITLGDSIACIVAAVSVVFFPIPVILHEAGHLLFGLACKMRFVSVCISRFRIYKEKGKLKINILKFAEHAGSCEMLPRGEEEGEGKTVAFALGGCALNLLYAFVCILLYCFLPLSPALLYFEIFALYSAYLGLTELYPADTPDGKTDGRFALDVLRKTPSAVLAMQVMQLQREVVEQGYGSLREDELFQLPVVAEDDVAFLSLTQLRYRYFVVKGEYERAGEFFARMDELYDYLPEISCEEVAAELSVYFTVTEEEEKAGDYLKKCVEQSYLSRLAGAAYLVRMENGDKNKLSALTLLTEDETGYEKALTEYAYDRVNGISVKRKGK